MMKLAWLAAVVLGLTGCATSLPETPRTCGVSDGPVAFGVAAFTGNMIGGNPFLGVYENGRFVAQADERWGFRRAAATAKRLYPLRCPLPALTVDGQRMLVRIEHDGAWEWDLGAEFFGKMSMPDGHSARGEALFWTAPVAVEPLVPTQIALAPVVLRRFQDEATRLFAMALMEREPDEREDDVILGTPLVQEIARLPILAVFFPARLRSETMLRDGRASLFFLYDPGEDRILFKTFGHVEWSPTAKTVRTVHPLLYFRIGADPEVYFLADYSGPWEELRYAIFQMRTGMRLLKSWIPEASPGEP